MMVIRSGNVNVAFCGGVDLAFTRRDGPNANHSFDPNRPSFLGGDWQSGALIPAPSVSWPLDSQVDYRSVRATTPPVETQASDLPDNVYSAFGQVWHDQHLKLERPIVATLEEQFGERWRDTCPRVYDTTTYFGQQATLGSQVIFSSAQAHQGTTIVPLDPPPPVAPTGSATVQMWRTIP